MSNLEKKLMMVINNNPLELGNFVNKNVGSRLFGNKKRDELVKLLPIIISNTNINNCNWIDTKNIKFYKTEGFLDIFINNINKFDFQNSEELIQILFNKLVVILPLNKKQTNFIIDKILECNCKISSHTINIIYKVLKEKKPVLGQLMIEKFINLEKTKDATIRFIIDNDDNSYIYKYIDFILENYDNVDLFTLMKKVEDNKELENKIKIKINENKKENVLITLRCLYEKYFDVHFFDKYTKKSFELVLEVIYLILEDICKNENIDISDMKILNGGAFSDVFELGDKVIKFGIKRGTKKFHNNPYINAILLRKEFPINDSTSLFVEVNEKVDTKSEIDDEELYQLYKNVRDIHLLWGDVDKRNVGRLLKDNKVYWREELPLNEQVLGLKNFRGKNIMLKKGDIVISDNDLIFDEEDDPKVIDRYIECNPLLKEFEKRYQQEKRINENLNRQTNRSENEYGKSGIRRT